MKPEQLRLNKNRLKNVLKHRISEIYQEQFKHQPKEIQVYFSEKSLIIIIEGILTKAEKLLTQNDRKTLAKQVREILNHLIESYFKTMIEEVIKVRIVDLLFNAKVDTDRLGAIAIFEIQSNSCD